MRRLIATAVLCASLVLTIGTKPVLAGACADEFSPCGSGTASSEGWGGLTRPAKFIRGKLICAVNVNAELARRGIQGTGSALAKSFLHWGRPSAPVPGAVAVMDRGRNPRAGHAAIVSRVEGGRVYVWNPGRKGWREVELRRPVRSYRVAS